MSQKSDMRKVYRRTKLCSICCPYCGATGDRIGVPKQPDYYHRCYDCGGDFEPMEAKT